MFCVKMFLFVLTTQITSCACSDANCKGDNCTENIEVPMIDRMRAPLTADFDITELTKQLRKLVNVEVQKSVKRAVKEEVENIVNNNIKEAEYKLIVNITNAVSDMKDYLNDSLTKSIAELDCWKNKTDTHLGIVKDCSDLRGHDFSSGVYQIYPKGYPGYKVYCDMTTDGGGWTVFQRRYNGTISFHDKLWNDYRYGFGNVSEEYWLGNDRLHELLSRGDYVLRVHIEDWANNARYAEYKLFNIGSASENYRLTVGKYSGNAGDSLATNNQTAFSTTDVQNDLRNADSSCASVNYIGAWWYPYGCGYSSLNGEYLQAGTKRSKGFGLMWSGWEGFSDSKKRTTMMVRRI